MGELYKYNRAKDTSACIYKAYRSWYADWDDTDAQIKELGYTEAFSYGKRSKGYSLTVYSNAQNPITEKHEDKKAKFFVDVVINNASDKYIIGDAASLTAFIVEFQPLIKIIEDKV